MSGPIQPPYTSRAGPSIPSPSAAGNPPAFGPLYNLPHFSSQAPVSGSNLHPRNGHTGQIYQHGGIPYGSRPQNSTTVSVGTMLYPLPRKLGLRIGPAYATPEMLSDEVKPKILSPNEFAVMIYSEQVKVIVGKVSDIRTFNMPRELLIWVSPYFKRALSPEWYNGEIVLDEDTPRAFTLAVYFIIRPDYTVIPILQVEQEDKDLISTLIELAGLGQSLMIPMLVHAAALNYMYTISNNKQGLLCEHVVAALQLLAEKSEMRRVVVEGVARELIEQDWPMSSNRDLTEGWKFAAVVGDPAYPAFVGELCLAVNDVHRGNYRRVRTVVDCELDDDY